MSFFTFLSPSYCKNKSEIAVVREWARRAFPTNPHDLIQVYLVSKHSVYYKIGPMESHWWKVLRPWWLRQGQLQITSRIVMCLPGQLEEALFQKNDQTSEEIKEQTRQGWVGIYSSPRFEVWEKVDLPLVQKPQPLRYGLTETEKKYLLSFARAALMESPGEPTARNFQYRLGTWQEDSIISPEFIERFSQTATLDVALWVDGELRGSQIVENISCLRGLYEATQRAREDIRFKPVNLDEFIKTRIEITLMSDLRIPLAATELSQDEIYPEKAYCVTQDEKRGWFVPAVFNCLVFRNLNQLLQGLQREKLLSNEPSVSPGNPFVCEVIDFIENVALTAPLTLTGTVISPPTSLRRKVEQTYPLSLLVSRVLDWMVGIQALDGSLPGAISPFIDEPQRVDWVRSAFSLQAMCQVVKTFPESAGMDTYTVAIKRGYQYLKNYLYTHKTMNARLRLASLVHYHAVARYLDDKAEVKRSWSMIISLLPGVGYDPILYAQLALHLFNYSEPNDVQGRETAWELTQEVWADFREKKKSGRLALAMFADLSNLLVLASLARGEDSLRLESEEIFQWYLKQQNADGSFPAYVGSHYAYTRGTAKVLEALTQKGLSSREGSFQNAIAWLHQLQYQEENIYFVKLGLQQRVLGGFRHDQHNATLWIDSAAHYLLAHVYAAKYQSLE